jgi:hypothetical protein
MGYDHSDCAALVGFCKCDVCVAARMPKQCIKHTAATNLDMWHLWTIRAESLAELAYHRRDMEDMGFIVGPIEVSKGWREHCLPCGWYFFSARIIKHVLAKHIFEALCAWDRVFGELPPVPTSNGECCND